jgi:hypothetical protein
MNPQPLTKTRSSAGSWLRNRRHRTEALPIAEPGRIVQCSTDTFALSDIELPHVIDHVMAQVCGPFRLGVCGSERRLRSHTWRAVRRRCRGALNGGRFLRAFFFSVETFSTIGYVNIVPVGVLPNFLGVAESLTTLALFGIGTGLVFSRFARPVAALDTATRQSSHYKGITAFEFCVVNLRTNQLVNVQAEVMFSRFENHRRCGAAALLRSST